MRAIQEAIMLGCGIFMILFAAAVIMSLTR